MTTLALAATLLLALADDPPPSKATEPAKAPTAAKPDAKAPAKQPPPAGILAEGASPTKICAGHRFTEGPVWVKDDSKAGGYLLFSDIPADAVYKWTPAPDGELAESKAQVFIQGSGLSNGLCVDPATGELLLAQHAGAVARMGPDGELKPVAGAFEGKALHSPNDLCVAPDGAVFFTDPPYGLRGSLSRKGRTRQLDFQGVYRLAPDASLTLVARDLPAPNGIALSPDHANLYVADTQAGKLHAFALDKSGAATNPRVLATGVSGADGVKVDTQGRVYVAAAGGVWVFTPAGDKLGVIALPEKPTNLCFGGKDNSTLFTTTGRSVFAVRTLATGEVKPAALRAVPKPATKDAENAPTPAPEAAPDSPKK